MRCLFKKALSTACLAVTSAALFSTGCNRRISVPITSIDLSDNKPIIGIDTWRIIGPFPLPANSQAYTDQVETAAFAHDYLVQIHGTEVPLNLPPPTSSVRINFTNDNLDSAAALGSQKGQFVDQVQTFPSPTIDSQLLFWQSFKVFTITYAAATLFSDKNTDAVFLIGSNSPLKVWLNNEVVAQPYSGSTGHGQDLRYIRRVHFLKGANSILVKLFYFPQRNDFAFRIATPARATQFIEDHAGIADVLDHVIIPQGTSLSLSDNLQFFAEDSDGRARVDLRNVEGQVVSTSLVNLASRREVSTRYLPDGLYSAHVLVGGHWMSEDFYLGNTDNLLKGYKARCSHHSLLIGKFDPCIAVKPLEDLVWGTRPTPRLGLEKQVLMLISQIEWTRHHVNPQTAIADERRFQLIGYHSRIDGQTQYYYIHLPKGYDGKHAVPLVIMPPYNTVHKSFLSGPPTSSVDALWNLLPPADSYGYAVIVPIARGENYAPIITTDILESLADAQRHYAIDTRRLYLIGACGQGRDAILLAERFPDRFAAASTFNAATGVQSTETGNYWADANNALLYVRNLEHMPFQLTHGDFNPHSPTLQAFVFKAEGQRVGEDVWLTLVPRDGMLGENGSRPTFEFFKGKTLPDSPSHISFATSQLKYNSDYWVRIERTIIPTRISSIDAKWESSNKVTISTTNVARLALLREKFPKSFQASQPLLICVNAVKRKVAASAQKIIELDVPHALTASSTRLFKTHEIEGPISDAFAGPFALVEGTGGNTWEQLESKHLVDEISKAWRNSYSTDCRHISDRNVTSRELATLNLVIVGKSSDKGILKHVRDMVPLTVTSSGMRVGDRDIAGTHLLAAMVYPNPSNPHRYVVVIDFNSESDLPDPDLASSGIYDAVVWKSDSQHRVVAGQWYWDSTWGSLKEAQKGGGLEVDPEGQDLLP